MEKVHNILVDILNEFIKIADAHNLTWFIDGGSLLGTIRHKGIVPWDDDIDIMMPRKDYELFLKYAEEELKEPYFLSTYGIEYKRFVQVLLTHASIGDVRTTRKNFSSTVQNLKKYRSTISIDIFPFDNIPDDNIEYAKWLNSIENALTENLPELIQQNEKLNTLFRKYENEETKRFGNLTTKLSPRKHFFNKTDYSSYTLMPFENTKVRVQNGWENHLNINYPGWKKYYSVGKSLHKTFILRPEIPYNENSEEDYQKLKESGYVDDFYKTYLKSGEIVNDIEKLWKNEDFKRFSC